jgi:hypothetical protein
MLSEKALKDIRSWARYISYSRSQDLRAVFSEFDQLRRIAKLAEKSLKFDSNESKGDKGLIEDVRTMKALEAAIAEWKRKD